MKLHRENKDLLTLITSIIVVFIGSIVVIGWIMNIPTFVQISKSFVPMQLNTAICFILSGIILNYSLGRKKYSHFYQILSITLFMISFTTLLQYILGHNYGIDEFLMKHYILTKSTFPGRMSPNSATCFILVSLTSLVKVFLSRYKVYLNLQLLIISLLFTLSATAFLGYIFSLDVTFVWQKYTRMALHTSLTFLIIASTSFYNTISSIKEDNDYNWIPIPTTLGFLFTFVLIGQIIKQTEINNIKQVIQNETNSLRSRIEIIIDDKVNDLKRLAKRSDIYKQQDENAWKKDAFSYLEANEQYIQLQRITENAKWTVTAHNKEVYFENKAKKEEILKQVKKLEKTLFSRIFSIRDIDEKKNRNVFYIAIPRFDFNKYVETTLVLVDVEKLFKSMLLNIDSQSFHIRFKENDKIIYTNTHSDISSITPVNFDLNSYNDNNWIIQINVTEQYVDSFRSSIGEVILIFGAFSSLLAGLLIYIYQDARTLKVKAQETEKIKSAILANMSHEIRTPMNGIIGMADLLSDNLSNKEDINKLNIIKESGSALLKIINDILDFSKLEAGKIHLDEQNFNIRELITKITQLFEIEAHAKGIYLKVEYEKDFPEYICSDEYRIRQIINNLLNNAIKFTSKGGVLIKASAKKTLTQGHDISISIIDTGIGISKQNQDLLFRDFSQVDLSTTRRFGGTGLGLSICKKLATYFNGSITVESELEKGATFTFNFKANTLCEGLTTTTKTNNIKLDKQSLKLDILVVDDNVINRKIAQEILKKFNCNTYSASNGNEALLIIEKNKIDIILMDCHMPILDGYKTTQKIIETYGENRPLIIALTASTMKEDILKCEEYGMDDFLAKPITSKAVYKVLSKYKEVDQVNKTLSSLKSDLLSYFDGDEKFMKESIDLLLSSQKKMLNNISKAIHTKDAHKIKNATHTYIGAISNFGLNELVTQAQLIEKNGQAHKFNTCEFQYLELKRQSQLSEKYLKQISEETKNV
ncbi:ATP-binding protein [Halobacteriovorax sp.]|uniref:ATP-binding protein n=1 Tax=Halobacteriovorax sp. TaxID=2020862 RepID=UPI003AF28E69